MQLWTIAGNMGTVYMDVHVHVEWLDEMGNIGIVHGCTCN